MLSVIIPTRDRAPLLRGCLASIARQTLAPERFEVVVVDNGSTDETPTILGEFSTQLALRVIDAREPGLHVGRHAGLAAASHDVLVYADDDIEARPGWLETYAGLFSDGRVAIAGGNNLPLFAQRPPDWLQAWWAQPVARGRALGTFSILDFGAGRFEVDPGWIWGCNFAVRRQVLMDCGGFHPDGFPRERIRWRGDGETHVTNHVRRNGARAVFDSGASVDHHVSAGRMTAEYVGWRAYQDGISASFTQLRESGGAPDANWQSRRDRSLGRARWRRRLAALNPVPGAGLRALGKIRLAALEAHWEGYVFHQAACAEDPGLMRWVLRKDYF